MINVSRLRAAGLTKEVSLGTVITTTPSRFVNIIPPDSFTPQIEPLPSKGIEAIADMYPKITQGPATLKGMKVKLEVEPENMGEMLQALFGLDTQTEVASFVVTNTNKFIDFKDNGGATLSASIVTATYPMGTSSAQAGTLCAAIKTALQAVGGFTYTVTYSYSTNKVTIATSGTTIQILWSTGPNAANSARDLLGFSHTDTAAALSVTSDLTTAKPPFQHLFIRQQVAQLPTYTWWFDKKPKYQLIGGAMINKMDIDAKAKGIVEADTEWEAIVYDDVDGTAQATAFSTLNPFVFSNVVINVDGSPVTGYDNFKLSMTNMVKADHTLTNSIYPQKIYAEGFEVQMSAELFFEDTVQYQKFLSATTAHFQVIITSGQSINGVFYSLTLDLPLVFYKTAPIYIPGNGPLKIPFTGLAKYNFAGSPAYTVQAALINGVFSQY